MASSNTREWEGTSVDVDHQRWGSDYIADVLKAYGFEYVSFNPGASFRGMEESIVNYNDNDPEVIETMHEGLSVSIAHGYAKASGNPGLCILHDVVGTLHGAMSVFNAYVDQVPILVLSGTGPMQKSKRRPWIEWIHTALVQGNLVREYVKWDDQPTDVTGVFDSIARAIKIAGTPPYGPTYVTLDHAIQEDELEDPIPIPDLRLFGPSRSMAPDPDGIEAAAARLVSADNPVIIVGNPGDHASTVDEIVQLAEALGAPVIDSLRERYNFPNTHPLFQFDSEVVSDADVVLGLDTRSLQFSLSGMTQPDTFPVHDPSFETILIGSHELGTSSLTADYCRITSADIGLLADTRLAVPALRSAVMETIDERAEQRAAARLEKHRTRREHKDEEFLEHAEAVWDETPISLPRLSLELWDVIADDPWVIVNGHLQRSVHKYWEIDDFDKYIGGNSGGAGIGYGLGAAIGGALAYRESDRIPINLQPDGDLMAYLGGLWTLGHYELPMFTVIHNNGTLYNSTAHRMRLAEYRGRDASFERALIGTGIHEPTPDYASVARAHDIAGFGPVEDPDDLPDVLEDAWQVVKNGAPAVVDVISQPR